MELKIEPHMSELKFEILRIRPGCHEGEIDVQLTWGFLVLGEQRKIDARKLMDRTIIDAINRLEDRQVQWAAIGHMLSQMRESIRKAAVKYGYIKDEKMD